MPKYLINLCLCSTMIGLLLFGCGRGPSPNNATVLNKTTADTSGAVSFQLDAWADNWFAAYLGETLLVED
ncbi:MAG: hypothetical protein KDE31_16620, partial [Caldilineaceae bacterium]|nr:hypothetical protein [Caldilineaceae bacterium]